MMFGFKNAKGGKVMELREVLKEQLNASHHENGWFVSLLNSIVNLSDEEADWKPNEDVHSIHEITTHLLYYNERYLHRFKEEPVDEQSKEDTFQLDEGVTFSHTRERIHHLYNDWKKNLEAADDLVMNHASEALSHLYLHTAYHTGQIILLRKLQGKWDASQGVEG